jgi:phage baseplate assembly protein W
MQGMNAQTGQLLSGLEHLRQSITDILSTPIGSRVMRREYGSRLFELIDAPVTQGTLIDLYAATAEALAKWEPRFKLNRVQSTGIAEDGRTSLTIEGEYLPEGREVSLEGILI